MSFSVTDGEQFNALVQVTGCATRPSQIIRCRSADRKTKAQFKPTVQGPNLYNMRLTAKGLSAVVTGAEQPQAEVVTVILYQGTSTERVDAIGDVNPCKAPGAPSGTSLVCVEKQ